MPGTTMISVTLYMTVSSTSMLYSRSYAVLRFFGTDNMEPPNYGPNRSQKHDKNYGQPPSPKVSVEIGQVSMVRKSLDYGSERHLITRAARYQFCRR